MSLIFKSVTVNVVDQVFHIYISISIQ